MFIPFLIGQGDKSQKKEEVATLGEDERKKEHKKVIISKVILIYKNGIHLIQVLKLFTSSLPITADLVPFVGVGGEEASLH